MKKPGLRGIATSVRKGQGTGGFRFIDLFAGIGGLRKGFDAISRTCAFTSEWDKFSVETYLASHERDHEVVGDIRNFPVDSIPAHDVLLAGFPCRPFSLAGVSKKNALGKKHQTS